MGEPIEFDENGTRIVYDPETDEYTKVAPRFSHHDTGGTKPAHVKAKRRATDKRARQARKANR
jgi:hypothetical protein